MDSNFTFTGQVRPVCQIGIADGRTPEPTSWLDVSCYVHEAELFRGRDRFTDRFEPGTASVTFKNTDGWADLVGSPSVIAERPLRPGRWIRVGVIGPWTGGTPFIRWLWRGWIDQTVPTYDPVEHDIVVANCVDSLGEAGHVPAPPGPFVGTFDSAGARIGRVLDTVEWFSTKRKIDPEAGIAPLQGTSMGGLAIDLMGQAADSTGGVVHGDPDGDVVYRNINWMLYDPDDPPDATVGNVDPGTPGIPFEPGYIDPTTGYVYWPAPPPMTHPTTITACASGGQGTLVEQGDAGELFVEDGRLRWRSGGRVWDVGEFPDEGGCVGVSIDSDGTPTRIDDPDEDGVWDVAPFPGDEITDELPPNVELLAYSDAGLADPTDANITVGPITPGLDCWMIVLLNTLGSESNTGFLTPSCVGGGADWTVVAMADEVGEGVASFIWVNQVGRVDPGEFTIAINWAGTVRGHACTVWRARNVSTLYRQHLDAGGFGGSVLRAATVSAPAFPEDVEPGNGEQTVQLLTGDGTPGTTVDTDSIIAQTMAEESTPPFGAVFATETPPWTVAPS